METCMNDLKKIYIYQTEDLLWEGGGDNSLFSIV